MNYLIGYFSRRQVFHIVEYSDTQEEVDEFLKTHNRRGLVVYTAQPSVQRIESKKCALEFGGYACTCGLHDTTQHMT